MKNLAIIWENFKVGGVSTHLEVLLNHKRFSKMNIIIYTNEDNKALYILKKKFKNSNIKFIKFKNLNCIKTNNVIFKIIYHFFLRPFFFLISIIYFYIIFKKIQNTVYLANCGGYGSFRSEMAAILAAYLSGNRSIYLLIHHCFNKPIAWNILLQFTNFLIYKCLNNIIFISKATEKNIKENVFAFKNTKKNLVIYNGIKTSKFKNKKILIFNKYNNFIKIGILSRIENVKGHNFLVNTVSEIRRDIRDRIKFFFIGNGDDKYLFSLKKLIIQKKLEKNFVFTGYLNYDSRQIINNLDLLLSLNQEFEGFGYSYVEAASLGVPVLVTNVGAAREIFKENLQILINHKNVNILKLKLIDFVENKHQYQNKAKKIKMIVNKKFNETIMVNKYINTLFKKN